MSVVQWRVAVQECRTWSGLPSADGRCRREEPRIRNKGSLVRFDSWIDLQLTLGSRSVESREQVSPFHVLSGSGLCALGQ